MFKPALLALCYWPALLCAQVGSLGLPPVVNYPKSAYRAGTQNWDIAQDAQGRILVANNEGLLLHDGVFWQKHPIANGTCVRSVAQAPDGHIYVGGQGEIGQFSPDAQGRLAYRSLTPLIPEGDRQFADVWDVVVGDDGAVYFRSDERLFQWKEGRIRPLSTGGRTLFFGKAGGQLLVHDANNGLLRFDGQHFTLLPGHPKPPSPVTALIALGGDSLLVATLKHGLFCWAGQRWAAWPTPIDNFLREKRIYCATALPGGQIALGSSMGGLVVLGRDRRPLQWLQKTEGLQNANILSVFTDRSHNLWLGLDNGMALVETSSPFYRLLPDGPLEGTGYAARVWGGQLWLGSSNGLFVQPYSAYRDPFAARHFSPVAGTAGQVWSLQDLGGELLLGHHEGAFALEGRSARPLGAGPGCWQFIPLGDTACVAGMYDGLAVFTRRGAGAAWQFSRRLSGLAESCRVLVRDASGVLWVSHPYRGIYRVLLHPDLRSMEVRLMGRREGLPTDLNNYVFEVGGEMLVGTERGVYRYVPERQGFEPAEAINAWIGGSGRVRYLRQDEAGHLWFCRGEEVGILWVQDRGLEKHIRRQVFPVLSGQLVGGFEHIFPVAGQGAFIGAEKGFLHIDPQRLQRADTSLQVIIGGVRLPGAQDSLLYGGFAPAHEPLLLPFRLNHLSVSFSAPAYGAHRQIQYSCRLQGFNEDWSAWSDKSEREYPSLPAGQYVFSVKARNEYGVESAAATFAFRIQPPWYASLPAKLLYALLLAVGLGWLLRRQRLHFEREKKALTTTHQQKSAEQQRLVERTEQELTRLRAEKLEGEVQHKNQELALATLHLVQKGEMLTTLQEELEKALRSKRPVHELQEDIRRVIRTMQMDTHLDTDWQQFAIHFDSVYGDFLKRLREQYPQITHHDLRLCAYLRMNLSTKEIAHLLNISVRGVEGSRYRLRKKLGLPGDANLVEVMMGV